MNASSPLPSDPSLAAEVSRCPYSSDDARSAFSALNLVLELTDPAQMPELIRVIKQAEDEIRYRMKRLNSVHFARFLPTRGNTALQVITEFDGLLEDYLYDFVIVVGDIFNDMLGFIKDPPPLPIQRDPDAFVEFVRRNNRVTVPPMVADEVSVFSSYHDKSVLDILGQYEVPATERDWWKEHALKREILDDATNAPAAVEDSVDLHDVQAHTLVALPVEEAVHIGLVFAPNDIRKARSFVGSLRNQVTSQGEITGRSHGWALNVGFTAAGLKALGVPGPILGAFPTAFLEGPVRRARANRDVGPHSPARWGFGHPEEPVHLMLSLHRYGPGPEDAGAKPGVEAANAANAEKDPAQDPAKLADEAFHTTLTKLVQLWLGTGLTEVFRLAVKLLPDRKFHFGYRDQIGQPQLRLDPSSSPPPGSGKTGSGTASDEHRWSRVGDFLLGDGYRNAYGAPSLGKLPTDLGHNGCFGVIRLLEQDVEAFERMLDTGHKDSGLCKEFLAAKFMGRRRDGRPLIRHGPEVDPQDTASDTASASADVPPRTPDLDNFNFLETPAGGTPTEEPDDFLGRICPRESHIRRMNPRQSRAAGTPWAHRIIRRGMPYSEGLVRSPKTGQETARKPAQETVTGKSESGRTDGDPRQVGPIKLGLLGVFYCTDIARQFEFLQQRWGYRSRPPDKPILDLQEAALASHFRSADPYHENEDPGLGDALCGAWAGDAASPSRPAPGLGFSFPCDAVTGGEQTLSWDKPLVETRGSLYLFVPGLAGLGQLADGGKLATFTSHLMATGQAPAISTPSRTRGPAAPTEPMPPGDLERFNPLHPAFIADPYPYYAEFRARAPVARIRLGQHYSQVWVFGHDLVKHVCEDEENFAKPLQGWPRQGLQYRTERDQRMHRGLMYLDKGRHQTAREAIEPVLKDASLGIERIATDLADRALSQLSRSREFDAVPSYVDRVPREVFMTLAGLPEGKWETFGSLVEKMLSYFNPLLTPAERAPYGVASRQFLAELTRLTPATGGSGGLFAMLQKANHHLNPLELQQTCLHFALGGYLSSAFALGTGMHRLLSEPSRLADYQTNPSATLEALLLDDPPFQTVERRYTGDNDTPFPVGPCTLPARARVPRLWKDETITVVLGSAMAGPPGKVLAADAFALGCPAGSAPPWSTSEVFGFGPHRCIGATLATTVLPIYFARWFARMPNLALAPPAPGRMPIRVPDPAFRGFKSLWLRY